MRHRCFLRVAVVAPSVLAFLAIGRVMAAPDVSAEPHGVYFFKNPNGIWITTYSKGGKGHTEAKLIVNGEVHEDRYQFKWSMKGREIIRVRTTKPELKIVEHDLYLPDGRIQPLKSYRDRKLLWEAPKDTGTMEYLGREAAR